MSKKLRITRIENLNKGPASTDTTLRNGHYCSVGHDGDSIASCVKNMLLNGQFHPGECVDVEELFGEYIGRFRIDSHGKLLKLPPTPTVTTGHR